jgi:hypothetical protein
MTAHILTAYEINHLCVELLDATPWRIEEILNNFNEGRGNYTNDIIGFALMGLARSQQRLEKGIYERNRNPTSV